MFVKSVIVYKPRRGYLGKLFKKEVEISWTSDLEIKFGLVATFCAAHETLCFVREVRRSWTSRYWKKRKTAFVSS